MARRVLNITVPAFLLLAVLFSCDEKIFTGDVDCSDYGCFLDKPDSADLTLHWSKGDEYDSIFIIVYEGTLDKGISLADSFMIFEDPAYLYLPVEREFTIKALYENAKDGKDIWVVDGTKTKLKRVSDYCDKGTCWMLDHADLHLELKY